MLPTIRQRVVIVTAMIIGAAAWLSVTSILIAPDGSDGVSLMSARVGVVAAVLIVAVVGVFALGFGLIASVMGNPLSGVFAVSGGLGVLACKTGAIDGWMRRSVLPDDYSDLMVEVLIWQAGVVIMLSAIQWLRSPMRAIWPALAYEDHLGVDIHLRFPQAQAWAAGAVCAVCGSGMGCLLIRDANVGQVVGSLVMSFGVGGLVAGLIFPQVNPVGILFSPAMVAIGAYAYARLGFQNADELLQVWYGQQLPGIVLVLPIHYASAGVAGCAVGVGLAQVIEASKVQAVGS